MQTQMWLLEEWMGLQSTFGEVGCRTRMVPQVHRRQSSILTGAKEVSQDQDNTGAATKATSRAWSGTTRRVVVSAGSFVRPCRVTKGLVSA